MHVHAITVDEKETINLQESEEGYMGGFGRRKGKEEMLQLKYHLKNKQKNGFSKAIKTFLQNIKSLENIFTL